MNDTSAAPPVALPFAPAVSEDLAIREDGRSKPLADSVPFVDRTEDETEQAQQHAEKIDQAFGVRPFFWKELQLASFAVDREGDWMRHRELLGEASLNEIVRFPNAMITDALRVLWFCAVDPSEWLSVPSMVQDEQKEWRRLSGQERALIVEQKIRAWAATNVDNNEAQLAVGVFYDIFNSAQATRTAVKPSEKQDTQAAKN